MPERTHADNRPADPANRLGLDYRNVPARKVSVPIVDVHSHVRRLDDARRFYEVADAYGIWHVFTMTPLSEVPPLHEAYPTRLSFIAIPDWREIDRSPAFQRSWLADLDAFRRVGASVAKFWMAPPMRGRFGLTLDDPFYEPIIDRALELGYAFMTHIADPTAWFEQGGRYADTTKYGTKRQQYDQLEFLLERVAPRPVIGAHMGGSIEEPEFLSGLLERHENFHLDTSATKWIVRGVAQHPDAVRKLVMRFRKRILFGSDLVTGPDYGFDHYASRYWTHLQMWESDYRGESPIEDPDADDPPRLAGLDLPAEVLREIYFGNAERLGLVGAGRLEAVQRPAVD